MATVSAKKITEALAKAKDIGFVEESFTIGDVTIVLRNLRPDQYAAINKETEELEGIEHLFRFQMSHISRAVVEVNGVDLRGVDFVEIEEEKDGKARPVKLERHEYLRTQLIEAWSRETLNVVWRKFGDILSAAESKAKEGVKFLLPETTPEERLRDLVGDLKEILPEVPETLVTAILEDAGLMRISTAEELRKAMETADELRRQQEAPQGAAFQPGPPQAVQAQQQAVPRQPTPAELMAMRVPLNTQPVTVPHPSAQPLQVAAPQVVPPTQADADAVLRAGTRAQKIATVEADTLDMDVPVPPPGDPNMAHRHVIPGAQTQPNAPHLQTAVPPPGAQQGAVLSKQGRERVDMGEFSKIVEKPPTGGINPRWRPPTRGM